MFYKVFVLLFFLNVVTAQIPEGRYRIINAESGTIVRATEVGAPIFVSKDLPPYDTDVVGFIHCCGIDSMCLHTWYL